GPMTLDMFAVIFAGATALLPVYAREILAVGAQGYGLLAAGLSFGTSLMTLILLARRPPERPGRALCLAVVVFGLATIAFGLSRSPPSSSPAWPTRSAWSRARRSSSSRRPTRCAAA